MTDQVDHSIAEPGHREPGIGHPRLSALLWLLTAAAGAALSLRVIARARYAGEDSWFPMSQALDFLHGRSGQSVYEALFFSRHIKFQYPPTALLSLEIGRHFNITTLLQYNFCNAGILIFTGLLFSLFVRGVAGKIYYSGIRVPLEPLAYLIALRFYPNNLAFEIGQMQLLLGLLFLAACYALLNDRPILAGCLIAVAGMTKPQFLPLGLVAMWNRNWPFVIGLLLVAAILAATSIWLYGWYNHADYLRVLSFLSRHGEFQHLNQSIGGILDRWLYRGPSLDRDPLGAIPQSAFPPYIVEVYVSVLVSSIAMFATPFLIKMKGTDRVSRLIGFCMAAALFTLASPIAWVHHFNVLLPGYAVAVRGIFDRWRGGRAWFALTLIGLSAVLVGYPIVPASSATDPARNLLQSHVFFGACLLIAVFLAEAITLPSHLAANAERNS